VGSIPVCRLPMDTVCVCLAAFILVGCQSAAEKREIVRRVIPEAILPGATDIQVHANSGDSELYFFEYSLADNPEDILPRLIANFSANWFIDELTSNTLVMSMVEPSPPFWDIHRIVSMFVSKDGTVVVLAAGLDTPVEIKIYETRALPDYIERVEELE
jgi:hypothetical protein